MNIDNYFEEINQKVQEQFLIAGKAREKGLDNVNRVEIPIATSLAEKAIGLISTIYPQINDKRIVERIIELEKEFGQLDSCVPFRIAEEIAKEKFCKFESLLQAIDAGIRVGFSYITLGVVSSPIEGFTGLKVKKTKNGEDYFVAYFSGPIRSAGTTAGCVVLMLIDYLREVFGYAKYDPDENEVKRYVTENYDYHERITNLQYLPSEEEITFLAKNIPVEISGEPSEDREVSNYKDLPRIETNFIRGGMCLIFSEGLAQKAQKGFRLWKGVQKKGFNVSGWEFLDEYIKIKNKKDKSKSDNTPTYIKDIVAGRPVFSHPSRSGGFRFRYGRSRNNGFSAVSVHPATMGITDSFLSGGTQLKIEKPTKGCTISSCDLIDGPIVKMKDGSVRKINNLEEAKKVYPDVKEIIYLGDILFTFGDVLNRNYELLKAGYVEEWWALEVEKKLERKLDFDKNEIGFVKAVEISEEIGVPLYPKFIFFWREIDYESFLFLIDWISNSKIVEDRLIMPYTLKDREFYHVAKRALEIVGCEHKVFLESVIVSGDEARALLINLGLEMNYDFGEKSLVVLKKVKESEEKEVLKIVNSLSKFIIKDKSGTFIGARMGRPEKAKLRKLVGSPHCLFPVGEEGGRLRSFNSALEVGYVRAEFPNFWCSKCNCESVYSKCESCGEFCSKRYYCPRCDEDKIDKCDIEGHNSLEYKERKVDIRNIFENARRKTKVGADEVPIIKGVKGTSNKDHICENLGKGLLRAKYNLHVNKDGTIRYDMTEMVLTHFRPREIGTSIEKLREMGYEKDVEGNKLINDEQILVLFPHDILLPVCPDTLDERADDVFSRICKFVDDELEILYGLPKFFNVKKKEDLIGALMVCIAPHICTATVARLIGFSKVQALVASPFMHAAMRRDCDGDESATMLLMDLLLNFSRSFLPAHRGGTQDAPLVLNTYIKAGDVDDQILDFETGPYPLELYELSEQGKHSSEVKIETVRQRLKDGKGAFSDLFITHNNSDINLGVTNTSYKILPSMADKVDKQMELCSKIRAVDVTDVARLIIERHFIRDTRGNLRKFSMQRFRCSSCNEKYRRPPLTGGCTKCGKRIIFTISEGSILKYMQKSLDLAREYDVGAYIIENLELTEMYIQSIFGKEKEKQEALKKWFN